MADPGYLPQTFPLWACDASQPKIDGAVDAALTYLGRAASWPQPLRYIAIRVVLHPGFGPGRVALKMPDPERVVGWRVTNAGAAPIVYGRWLERAWADTSARKVRRLLRSYLAAVVQARLDGGSDPGEIVDAEIVDG